MTLGSAFEPTEPTPAISKAPHDYRAIVLEAPHERGKAQLAANRLMPLLACLLGIGTFSVSERISFNGGLGWDGAIYAKWVKDFYHQTFEVGTDAYRIQRVLPAAITHYVFRALRIEPSDENIIAAFGLMNIISITGVAFFWTRITDLLEISTRGKWLGFVALLVNYAVLKNATFNPVLTDLQAYAVSAGMVWAYLSRRQLALFALTAIGAFIWPTLIFIGGLLILFPCEQSADSCEAPAPRFAKFAGAGLLALYAGLGICYVLRTTQGPVFGFLQPILAVLPLSVLIAVAYVFLGSLPLVDTPRLFRLHRCFSSSWIANLVAFIAMFVMIKSLQGAMTDRPGYMAVSVYFLTVGVGAVAKPAVFLVSHLVYFGPWLLVAPLLWRPACRLIHGYGAGLTLAVLVGFLHSLDSESRHEIYLVPMIVPFLAKASDSLDLTRQACIGFAVLSGLTSKVWLVIHGEFVDNVFVYPDQLYWMHHGPFMGNTMYLAQATGIVAAAAVIYGIGLRQAHQETLIKHRIDSSTNRLCA